MRRGDAELPIDGTVSRRDAARLLLCLSGMATNTTHKLKSDETITEAAKLSDIATKKNS